MYTVPSNYTWATTWQNVSLGVSNQARHKAACAATDASYSLEISAIESRDIILPKQRTTKALTRLRGCAGWSVPLLFAYDIRHIFSWPGSHVLSREQKMCWSDCKFLFCSHRFCRDAVHVAVQFITSRNPHYKNEKLSITGVHTGWLKYKRC